MVHVSETPMAQGLLDCPAKLRSTLAAEGPRYGAAQYAGFVLNSFFGIAP